jgi:hypothetical protein
LERRELDRIGLVIQTKRDWRGAEGKGVERTGEDWIGLVIQTKKEMRGLVRRGYDGNGDERTGTERHGKERFIQNREDWTGWELIGEE